MNFHSAARAYWAADREGKPVASAKALREAVMAGSAEQVAEFVREVQIRAGKQDLALLPETTWKMDGKDNFGHWDNRPERMAERATVPNTTDLRMLLESESARGVRISWPSIVSHHGVSVFWTDGDREYRAFSADYGVTETYLSS